MQPTTTQHQKDNPARQEDSENSQLQRIETLTSDLKHLLEKNNSAFDDEIIHRQVDLLEHWMYCLRRNLVTADTFSDASFALLNDLRARLKLAEEEMQRLEDEGGSIANKEQIEKNEELLQAIRRSEKLLSNIEELFTHH